MKDSLAIKDLIALDSRHKGENEGGGADRPPPKAQQAIAQTSTYHGNQPLAAFTSSTRFAAETIASSDAPTMLVLMPAPNSLPPG
jgi:hypothetical protein